MLVPRYHYILPLLLLISSSSWANLISDKQSNLCSDEEVFSDSSQMTTKLGGLSNQTASNSAQIDHLARFAVEEHNKKENALLEFTRVVKAQEQLVAGTLHHLTVEAVDAGKKKFFEAKVWVKPWMNFKELQEFKYTGEATADEGRPGLQSVPVHDPAVQDAANHVLKTLQQRSNSLYPYELQEVVQANSEVLEGIAKFDMLVKVKRGDKEEKFKVDVHKDDTGNFHLNKMVQDD